MSLTKEQLDEIAARYHQSDAIPDKAIEDALQLHTLAWFREQLQPSRSVLELGYGEGIVTEDLVKTGKKVTQVEGSARLVDEVRQRYGTKVTCVHAMFEEFETDELFDAVVASHVLEHVDDPIAVLRRMRSWIRPDGRILIIVPNSESIHRRLAVLMNLQPRLDSLSPRDHLVGHQRVYSLEGLVSDVHAANLDVLSARGFFFKPLPNSMMLEFSPELIDAMNRLATEMPAEWLANLGVVAVPRPA
jgi:2-polyprenyl-3-methyl-5-hydroxy-6-metoxy-1,4-benzoquinol methylase